AYKQPITKGEMEAIRGVSCDYAVQKLLEKELIVITGRNEKLPGHPLVYATSRTFMDYFGINSPEDLPKIREIISSELVEPTGVMSDFLQVAGDEEEELSSSDALLVTEEGDLIEQDITDEETTSTEDAAIEDIILEDVVLLEEETSEESETEEEPSATEEEITDEQEVEEKKDEGDGENL
ncbi:MAG: SMC-Scp complex subunit ScpB, partial [Lacibacter sp.]